MLTDTETRRVKLISALLEEKARASDAFTRYITTPRVYEGGGGELLYMREAHFILAVGPGEGRTMSEIAQALGVTQGAVSQLAARLEKKGYILRRRTPENHRQVLVTLTPLGEEACRTHQNFDDAQYAQMDRDCFSRFTEEELRKFWEYEHIICTHFTKVNEQK